MKRSPLVRHPKAKGNQYEAHLIRTCDIVWPSMRRNFASGGQGGSDFTGTPGYAVEAKKREKLNIWAALAQVEESASPTETPLVIFARNRSRDYVVLPLDDFLPLIQASQLPLGHDVAKA